MTTISLETRSKIDMQRRAVALLARVHDKGARAGLEPLTWLVGQSGIAGEVSSLSVGTGQARATLQAWAGLLGLRLRVSERITDRDRLYAAVDDYRGCGAGLAISADLWATDDRG